MSFFAKYFVRVFTQLIVRDHVKSVVNSVGNLYTRRWTSSPRGSTESAMLRRAAVHVDKVAPGYRGRSLALPYAFVILGLSAVVVPVLVAVVFVG